jgi:hypothetical protein
MRSARNTTTPSSTQGAKSSAAISTSRARTRRTRSSGSVNDPVVWNTRTSSMRSRASPCRLALWSRTQTEIRLSSRTASRYSSWVADRPVGVIAPYRSATTPR